MNRQSCESVREFLVGYGDGELPADRAHQVADHLAGCEHCRRELAALRRSLELARGIWAESAIDPSAGLAARPRRTARRLWPAVAAACVILAVGAAVVWRSMAGGGSVPTGPAPAALSVRDVRARIRREDISARLAASAHILSLQPGGLEAAEEAYRYLARAYPDTSAGREAARRISPDQGAIQ